MRILGIDPGTRGGLAVIEISDGAAPQLVDAIDIPVIGVGAKERVDVIAIRNWIILYRPCSTPDRTRASLRFRALPVSNLRADNRQPRKRNRLLRDPADDRRAISVEKFHHLRGGDKEGGRQRALQLF